MSSEVNWELLSATLSDTPGLLAVWVFGSAQGGIIRSGGDLDVGLLFEHKPDLDTLVELRARLQLALQFDEIDLVVLNDAAPILRFEAVSGRLVYCKDDGERVAFVSLTAREYESEMAFLQWGLAIRAQAQGIAR